MQNLPIYMQRRHDALRKVYSLLVNKKETVSRLFDFNKTEHADLELLWINPDFQRKNIGTTEDYQIVIATVKSSQISDAHLHEVGASSFIVLGPKIGLPAPTNLIYRTGVLNFPSGKIEMKAETICYEELEMDIPAYQVHQFQNQNSEPAQILIVTHPIISVENGNEDIFTGTISDLEESDR